MIREKISHHCHGTPSKVYTNSVPEQHYQYPDEQHIHAIYAKCVMTVGCSGESKFEGYKRGSSRWENSPF